MYDPLLVRESIEQTAKIVDEKVEDFFPDNTVRLPDFVVPKETTAEEQLVKLAEHGLYLKRNVIISHGGDYGEYVERLNLELDVICGKRFAKYFLTMHQAVIEAKSIMLTGPGRGSAAGCLLSYALGITQIDPLRFGLQFERFMRSDQKDYPDIDFDVAHRIHLSDHLTAKWGEDRVVAITNWNTLGLKSLIKDLAKFAGIDFVEANELTKSFEPAYESIKVERGQSAGVLYPPATHDEMTRHCEEYAAFFKLYPDLEPYVEKLNGSLRSKGRHAGGIVIAEDIPSYMPLIRGAALK